MYFIPTEKLKLSELRLKVIKIYTNYKTIHFNKLTN